MQSHLIFSRIRQLAQEKEKRVYVFCEDVAASGGYFLALAGDEIYADPSSIVGSIGVISASFGLDKFIDRFGIERRVHTSGKDKGALDPFQPERAGGRRAAEGAAAQRSRCLHRQSSSERRAGKLKGPEEELFSGAFWSAAKAPGIRPDRRHRRPALARCRPCTASKVRLSAVPLAHGGLLSRFRRLPGFQLASDDGFAFPASLADDLVSAVEARALWSRFGL